jgi:ABC-type glycerol-3-phosphate transport system permease component
MNTVIIVFAILVALGWLAYWIWTIVARFKSEEEPEEPPKNLQEKKKSFENYIDKLKNYELKPYKRKDKADK